MDQNSQVVDNEKFNNYLSLMFSCDGDTDADIESSMRDYADEAFHRDTPMQRIFREAMYSSNAGKGD